MMNWNVYIEYRVQCTANPVDILFLLVGTDEKNNGIHEMCDNACFSCITKHTKQLPVDYQIA